MHRMQPAAGALLTVFLSEFSVPSTTPVGTQRNSHDMMVTVMATVMVMVVEAAP